MLIARSNQTIEYSNSQYVGEVKDRIELILTLDKIIPIQQGYAVALYNWHDREGNLFVWFASRDSFDYQEGQEYRIKATIKRHQAYRGVKQTIINRLKLVQLMYKSFARASVEQTGHEQTVNEAWESL
jgi:hypothetical protein